MNEALTFTVIDSRNTKLSQHNSGGATPTEVRGVCTLAHTTDLHQVLCRIEVPQLCGMHETTILGHVGVMVRVERMKQRSYGHMFAYLLKVFLKTLSFYCQGSSLALPYRTQVGVSLHH